MSRLLGDVKTNEASKFIWIKLGEQRGALNFIKILTSVFYLSCFFFAKHINFFPKSASPGSHILMNEVVTLPLQLTTSNYVLIFFSIAPTLSFYLYQCYLYSPSCLPFFFSISKPRLQDYWSSLLAHSLPSDSYLSITITQCCQINFHSIQW